MRVSKLIMVILVQATLIFAQAEQVAQRRVIFLHTNDSHFNYKYAQDIKHVVDRFRQEYSNVLLLDAGDVSIREDRWQNLNIVKNSDDYARLLERMISTMNLLGYDAMTLGNHDLGYHKTLTRDYFQKADFKILSANVSVATDEFIQPAPFMLKKFDDGLRVALLGVSAGEFANAEGITLRNHTKVIEDYSNLRKRCDVFVLLSHLGASTDRKMAEKFGDKIDLIIGGHSHTMINPPEMTNSVMIAQVGVGYSKDQSMGAIRLTLDSDGKVVEKEGEVLSFAGEGVPESRFLKDGK